jgi:hypothetical protein
MRPRRSTRRRCIRGRRETVDNGPFDYAQDKRWTVKPGKFLVFALVAAALALAACGTSGAQTPVATARSMVLPTLPIQYSTPLPTNTPRPTATYAPSDLVYWATATGIAFYESKCKGLYFERGFMSPDLTWTVCYNYKEVRLVNKDGVQWDFWVAQEYGIDSFPGEFRPLHWTQDGLYVYVVSYLIIDGGDIPFYGSEFALWRIYLLNGTVSEIIRPVISYDGLLVHPLYDISISPTDRRLAFIQQAATPMSVTIMDIQTGDEEIVPMPADMINAGIFAWSPDGTVLIVEMVGITGDSFEKTGFFTLWYIDFANVSNGTFIEHSSTDFRVVEKDDSFLTFTNSENIWQFDFHTHVFAFLGTVTPTPTP